MRVRCWQLLVILAAEPALAQSQTVPVEPERFERTGVFKAAGLDESSGVAVSRHQPGVLWTHNDSGDDARIFATNLMGDDLGTYRVIGADAEDWEDLALGPCPNARGDCLYIADTGDNDGTRQSVAIYVVPEPPAPAPPNARTARARRLRVRYPDGPHDVEALAVAPDGQISLITKGRDGAVRHYRIAPSALGRATIVPDGPDTLETIPRGALPQLVTGAAVSPDGAWMAVRAYLQIRLYHRAADGRLRPAGPPCWLGPREAQGEAIDFLDADTLVLTSEAGFGQPASISMVRCPMPGASAERP